MSRELEGVIEQIRREYYASPPSSKVDLNAALVRGVPEELLALYSLCDAALIGSGSDFYADNGQGYRLKIPHLAKLQTVQEFGFISESCPLFDVSEHWWQIVDYGDSNWLAYDSSAGANGRIIDVFHETVGQIGSHNIVATSLTNLLDRLLRQGGVYWLGDFESFGAV